MNLKQALDIHPNEVISLVGGGGKTTLMFAIAHELVRAGNRVLTTTTTKISEPPSSPASRLLVAKNGERLLALLRQQIDRYPHITLAREKLSSGKLGGIDPGLVQRLAGLEPVSCIVIEADGAAHRPLKAPNATEPVIPDATSLVIAVVGVDALGRRLTGDNVFRPEIAAGLLGVPLGTTVTAGLITRLLTHPQGIAKGSPPGARLIPFLNKIESAADLGQGRALANAILAAGDPRIKRVVLGRAQSPEPVLEVVGEKAD